MSGKRSAISILSDRIEETGELLEHAIGVVFLAAAVVVITCVVVLVAAGTFGILHPGNDFNFGHGSGGGGDIIVVPAPPF
jgi:hypothetical protein